MFQRTARLESKHKCSMCLPAVILCLLPLVGLVSGCSTAKVVHVESDASFDYSTAASGEVAIAGFRVMDEDADRRAALERNLPATLAQSIQKRWPDMQIFSPEHFQSVVGPVACSVMLESYAERGTLDSLDLELLSTAFKDMARYVIVGRVESDDITKSEAEDTDTISPGTWYYTKREIAVTLEVYDVQARTSVFRTLIKNDKTTSRKTLDVTPGNAKSFSEGCVNMIGSCIGSLLFDLFQKKPQDDGFPVPPSTAEIMTDVFDKFAESLPEPKSG